MNWRQNPTRVAWVILTVSFMSCCILAVAVLALYAASGGPVYNGGGPRPRRR